MRSKSEQVIYVTFWMSRDVDAETGETDATVDVWFSRPRCYEVGDHGIVWLDSEDGLSDRHACWTLAEAVARTGTYPDDGRQLIRHGDERNTRRAYIERSSKAFAGVV